MAISSVRKLTDKSDHPPVAPVISNRLRETVFCLFRCRLLLLLVGAGAILWVLILLPLLFGPSLHTGFYSFLAATGLVLLGGSMWMTWRDYIQPTQGLRRWILALRSGDLAARMSVPRHGEFSELNEDFNDLGQMLQTLSQNTEQQLAQYTEYTAQKTRSLQLLYDVAASVNVSRDLKDLLTRFLHTLTELVGARAGAVRLLTEDGQMQLVTATGLAEEIAELEQSLPTQSCLCGKAAEGQSVLFERLPCDHLLSQNTNSELAMVAVPLQYRDKTLGVYNLFVEPDAFNEQEGLPELLTSVGRHLGMAIEKANVEEEARRLTIMEERTLMAHELHDSLAQTLASVRFQVRVLDETFHQDDEAATWQALERIENTLDEAHTELRELIARFRAPPEQRELIPAIEQAVARFRQECDIHVFLQTDWPSITLPEDYDIQILRIVQEALVNTRKHSQAEAVRVMMRGDEAGHFKVLVEDDGVGISEPPSSEPGHHLGLSIMADRARRIHGRLEIESEPGEGTCVVLEFDFPDAAHQETKRVHSA